MELEPPPLGTRERWAWEYVTTSSLAHKLSPPPMPAEWEHHAPPRRLERPGRPAGLVLASKKARTPGPEALRSPARRAQLVHTFLHHELQAAELFAWALLAFADAPRAFRAGLVGVLGEELEHARAYDEHLRALGVTFGSLPVRDWFWERIPACTTPLAFVATMGMGFEGGNLDHMERFAERFRAVGDAQGASLLERVHADEVGHVRFARLWFCKLLGRELEGEALFEAFRLALPPPLSPMVMRGAPLARGARMRAGQDAAFCEALEAWAPSPGS
jgi:uncharacterized ferritin-like protein (DUF455 family)